MHLRIIIISATCPYKNAWIPIMHVIELFCWHILANKLTYLLVGFKPSRVLSMCGISRYLLMTIFLIFPPDRLAGSSLIYVFSIRLRTLVLCRVLSTCVYLIGRSEVLDTFPYTYLAISQSQKNARNAATGWKGSGHSLEFIISKITMNWTFFTLCLVAYLMSRLVVFGPLWRLP